MSSLKVTKTIYGRYACSDISVPTLFNKEAYQLLHFQQNEIII